MKSVTSPTSNTITNGYVNDVNVVVHAEWLMNRFYRTVVDNTPSESTDGYDVEMFPIESITKQNRPNAGIVKAVADQATAQPEYHDSVPAARYYICSREDQYKYWQSPVTSAASTPWAITNTAPQVTYVEDNDVSGSPVPKVIKANKIYFTIENTFAYPTNYNVQIKSTTGGAWTTVSTSPAIGTGGKVELWWNGSAWTTTKNLTGTPQDISAVRLVINNMNKTAYFNLIELGVALELDLSADVIAVQSDHAMGEADFITPLGNISSNTGNINLFNGDTRKYSNDNPASVLYGLLDKGVTFKCWFDYSGELIQEFEMISGTWKEDESEVTVALTDNTQFFMDIKPRVVLYQNMPVQEIVWRLCDIIGFTDYEVTALNTEPHSIIDIFWTDGEKTAWEIFGDLARATQTAIFFDSFGKLQVMSRGAAWDNTKPVDYTFIRNTIPGGQPANIVSLEDNSEYEANKVTVNWKPTSFSEMVDNVVPFEVVWQPDSTVVLRASELAASLTGASTYITLRQADGSTWPFSGMCNIEGEWISYDAKYYVYYTAGNVRTATWVTSLEQQQRLDAQTGPFYRHMNQYSGLLRIKERGLYNTESRDHNINLTGWTKSRKRNYSTVISPCPGISRDIATSTLVIDSTNSQEDDYAYLHRGSTANDGYSRLGFRMKIANSAHKSRIGGLAFDMDGTFGAGYYLEITATSRMSSKMRQSRNEISFYSMKSDGTKKYYGGTQVNMKDLSRNYPGGATVNNDTGAAFAVPLNYFVDIDIIVSRGSSHVFQIWANGRFLFQATVPAASGWQHTKNERFGLYARGNSKVYFDYVYAINNIGNVMLDDESYFDRIEGGYRGNQYELDWTYQWRQAVRKQKKKTVKYQQKYNARFYDEFGPIVHEIRQFDVKFTNSTPSLQSKLYFSNTTQAVCTEYWSDPKNAHFIMANISRENAVINGDDTLTTGGNGSINHKLFVYGRPVIQKDAQQIVKTDDWSIRRRGIIDVEYNSDWIQNESEANRFADWLTTHWSRSDSTLELEVFGNPLIELTDVVHVDYLDIDADYYVIKIGNQFDRGLTTTLTLRKVTP